MICDGKFMCDLAFHRSPYILSQHLRGERRRITRIFSISGLMQSNLFRSQIVSIRMVSSAKQIHKLRAASVGSGKMNAKEAISCPYGVQGFGGLSDVEGNSRRIQGNSAE
jgi:hypothetical protein